MAVGSGISAQFGIKTETTWGAPVTPDRFLEMNSEGIQETFQDMKSTGLGSGGFLRSTHIVRKSIGAAGPVEFDVMDKGFGVLFKHMLGTMTTTTVVGAERRHRATVDLATRMQGLGATVQIGKPSVNGTVNPFTYEGGKISEWELSTEHGGLLVLSTTWDFETVLTGTALAAASFLAGRTPYVYADTTAMTLGGVETCAQSIKLTGNNGLSYERFCIGSTNHKEPLANELVAITGELDCEFESLAQYTAIQNDTVQALVWTITGGTIPGGAGEGPFKIVINAPAIHFTGTPPVVEGPDILRVTLPFEVLYDGTNNPLTIDYHSDDTTA